MINEEKQKVLCRVNELINKRTSELIKELPSVHEVDDGIIIRFFTEWDNCEDSDEIKYKKVTNHDNPDESVVFFYIPKDSFFSLKQRFFIGCMTCLNGTIEIITEKETRTLNSYSRMCVNTDDVQGKAIENTYLVVTSNRSDWSEKTMTYVKEAGY